MLLVALTGGIASGKSIIAGVLQDLGCYIHHSDSAAHKLMEPGKQAWKATVERFGRNILNPDDTIDRQKLGSIVFSNQNDRDFLNSLLHPLVMEEKKTVIAKIEPGKKYKIFISEAALTIESGYIDYFDKIVVAYCSKEIQIARLMERDNIDRKGALKKFRSQLSPEEKLKYADYIIDTSGNIRSTIEQSEKVFRNLMTDFTLKHDNTS